MTRFERTVAAAGSLAGVIALAYTVGLLRSYQSSEAPSSTNSLIIMGSGLSLEKPVSKSIAHSDQDTNKHKIDNIHSLTPTIEKKSDKITKNRNINNVEMKIEEKQNFIDSQEKNEKIQPIESELFNKLEKKVIQNSLEDGVYMGNYYCSQGQTNLILEVFEKNEDSQIAIFKFGGDGKPAGSYHVMVRSIGRNKFKLIPLKWEDRPSGYHMVGATINVYDKIISGSISGDRNCGELNAVRQQ